MDTVRKAGKWEGEAVEMLDRWNCRSWLTVCSIAWLRIYIPIFSIIMHQQQQEHHHHEFISSFLFGLLALNVQYLPALPLALCFVLHSTTTTTTTCLAASSLLSYTYTFPTITIFPILACRPRSPYSSPKHAATSVPYGAQVRIGLCDYGVAFHFLSYNSFSLFLS